jgi:hypothetical protein
LYRVWPRLAAFGRIFLWILHLRTEGVFVQAHDGRLAGGVVDSDGVKPARAFFDAALRQEVLPIASQEVLFTPGDARSGKADISSRTVRVRTSTKASVLPS